MTLGFGIAAWPHGDESIVGVAADTRLSAGHAVLTDAGIKTYELGGRCAVVASGHALPPMIASELTRSIVENHNRRTPERRIGFVDTARLFGFFLKRAASEQGAAVLAVVAGYSSTDKPRLAVVTVSPEVSRVTFREVLPGETVAIPVGEPRAARLLLESMASARRSQRPVVQAALSILYHIARLDGAFKSVGGGVSVGACRASETHFSWPVIEIDNALFLRGVNVTAFHRSTWPAPERIPYDEGWCSAEDQRVAALPELELEGARPSLALPSINLDTLDPETLFATHHEEVDE